jgi:hypothetical protein
MSNVLFNYFSARTSFRSITLPALPNKPGWYLELDSLWNEITAKRLKGKWTVQTTLAFQPFPHSIGKASESKGGNAMNLKGTDHERFVVEIAGIYFSAADDALIQSVSKEFTDTIFKQLEGLRANAKTKGESFPEYNPYFMNDAGLDQDVMGSYTNVAKFSKMQKSIDPKGFFAKRAGGFKYRA